MNYLAENALPIWIGGAVLVALALVVYLQLRTKRASLGVLAAVLATAAFLIAEWMIVTPREAIEGAIDEIAAAIEANDLPGVLAHISPAGGQARTDAETLMPLVRIEKANIMNTPLIELNPPGYPTEAVVQLRALVDATAKKDGIRGLMIADVTATFVRQDHQWLVYDYTATPQGGPNR